MTVSYKMYIGGQWFGAENYFDDINPATEEIIGKFPSGTVGEVNAAVDAAQDAFKKWSETPPPARARVLFRVAEILRSQKERLAQILTVEMGKILPEAKGDVQEAIDIFEYMAGEGRRLFGHTTTSELKDKFCMTIRRSVGVVSLITPWNFPIAIPAWKLAPALVCGNTVILKPSSDTPRCVYELVRILEQAGVPKGVVNFVTGPASTVGVAIVKHQEIRAISFTGSKATGDWLVKNAGLKKVCLELGGKNPIIVMEDANLELVVEGVLWGAFSTTGQRCTATSRVIVNKKIKQKLLRILVNRAKKLQLGSGLLPATDLGPVINRTAIDKIEKYVEIGKYEGAKLLCGGTHPNTKGFFYNPTIFDDVTPDMQIAKEEIFGPVLSVIEFEKIDQAIEIANSTEYGLSSSIYTQNINTAFNAIEKIEAGITYINSPTIGAESHLPFGGIKKSGNTREAGIHGIDEFSDIKTVYIDYSGKLQKAQIDIKD